MSILPQNKPPTATGVNEANEDDGPVYKGAMTKEDFTQIVKDLEQSYEDENKRRGKKKDRSMEQMVELSKMTHEHCYQLDNGMIVSPKWCREYLKALDSWDMWMVERLSNK